MDDLKISRTVYFFQVEQIWSLVNIVTPVLPFGNDVTWISKNT